MKKYIFIIIGILIFVNQINAQKNQTNAFMKQDLVMEYSVPFSLDYIKKASKDSLDKFLRTQYLKNEPVSGVDFRKIILDRGLYSTLPVYDWDVIQKYADYPYNIFSADTLRKIWAMEMAGLRSVIEMVKDTATGKLTEKRFNIQPKPENLSRFIFIESWNFDEEKFSMSKNVWGYYPVRIFYADEDTQMENPRMMKTFLVLQPDIANGKNIATHAKKSVLFMKAKYEFFIQDIEEIAPMCLYLKRNQFELLDFFYCMDTWNSPFWNYYSKYKFLNLIIGNVENGKQQAYDFNTGDKMTADQAMKAIGAGEKVQLIEDAATNKTVENKIKIQPQIQNIHSVVFIENWYLNPDNLYITKEVVGVALMYSDPNGEKNSDGFPIRKPAFVVYFNKWK